jgi:hypothetical protein
LLGLLLWRLPVVGRIATAVWYFMVLNAALLLGTMKFLTGRSASVWQRTSRTGDIRERTRVQKSRAKAMTGRKEDRRAA